jgi:hypothetical protein
MTGVIVAFETPSQREERLYRECEQALQSYSAERTKTSQQALQDAVRRWKTARIALRTQKRSGPTAKRFGP